MACVGQNQKNCHASTPFSMTIFLKNASVKARSHFDRVYAERSRSAANDTWFKELIFKLLKSVIFKELDLQNSLRSA